MWKTWSCANHALGLFTKAAYITNLTWTTAHTDLPHTARCVFQCAVSASRQDDDKSWSVTLGQADQEPCCRSQRCVFPRLAEVIRSQPCTRLQLFLPINRWRHSLTCHLVQHLRLNNIHCRPWKRANLFLTVCQKLTHRLLNVATILVKVERWNSKNVTLQRDTTKNCIKCIPASPKGPETRTLYFYSLHFAWVVDDAIVVTRVRVCVCVCLSPAACLHRCHLGEW